MCGILFGIHPSDIQGRPMPDAYASTWSELQLLNARRGPSAQDVHQLTVSNVNAHDAACDLTFYGAVLHLRGDTVARQPHVSTAGNILLWNGEIFDGIAVDHHQNDGQVLMSLLESISEVHSGTPSDADHTNAFLEIMSKIEGPYAFVYYHATSQRLFFGRDCLGRRSLLWHKEKQGEHGLELPFLLTSVGYSSFRSDLMPLDEVPADGIYCMSLKTGTNEKTLSHFPWIPSSAVVDRLSYNISLGMPLPFGKVNDTLPTPDQLPEPFPEDLKFNSAHPEVVPKMTKDMEQAVADMIEVLGDSVRRRVQDIPRTGLIHDARVGILFSGGLDCLCLAALADRFLPEGEAIDLLNVGFENPRSEKAKAAEEALALKRLKKQQQISQKKGSNSSNSSQGSNTTSVETPVTVSSSKFNVPDRMTGYESLAELRRIAPNRHWNFVEVNIPFEEATAQRYEILERIAPLETVMDLSIAMAFWFASRGIGHIKDAEGKISPYTSQAKVLLSGLGADEQLGGYSRHKDHFEAASWKGLIHELQLDLDRISTRNLGRDDRIISDHGKEARYPFLSTNVVRFLSNLPVHLKVDLRYPRGVGEKILLRNVARALGFERASTHWKRAVQFGARTAKMTESGRSEIGQQVVDRRAAE
ncbi:asparagine synthase (glutamine-hydrolysing) [Entomortierella parvispora]|uniref:Asparagine synthase (Glutamine-hydrolysing) n=1 Tax=Entomortierella parvispora TaxID=205924 RepID=A0A9P3LW63_9FUNG|nr:asparagine synthase (glutamine-hydrolysing) [Entomortierella parvispora]